MLHALNVHCVTDDEYVHVWPDSIIIKIAIGVIAVCPPELWQITEEISINWRLTHSENRPDLIRSIAFNYCACCVFATLAHYNGVKVGFGLLVFNDTFSTKRLYRATGVWNLLCRVGGQYKDTIKQRNNTINQENHKHSSAWALWKRSPRHG